MSGCVCIITFRWMLLEANGVEREKSFVIVFRGLSCLAEQIRAVPGLRGEAPLFTRVPFSTSRQRLTAYWDHHHDLRSPPCHAIFFVASISLYRRPMGSELCDFLQAFLMDGIFIGVDLKEYVTFIFIYVDLNYSRTSIIRGQINRRAAQPCA